MPQGYGIPAKVQIGIHAGKNCRPLYCCAKLPEPLEWHLSWQPVLIVLVPDPAQNVERVEVGLGKTVEDSDRNYFKVRPGLHEPLGLAVEQARAQMAAAGFTCTDLRPAGTDGDARSHVRCEAFDENSMGGRIVRVHLYADEPGIVREAKVVHEWGCFDAERCMFPHGDESAGKAVLKGVLFPVRESGRYAVVGLEAAVLIVAISAYPYGK
jgi:hypothetical protein